MSYREETKSMQSEIDSLRMDNRELRAHLERWEREHAVTRVLRESARYATYWLTGCAVLGMVVLMAFGLIGLWRHITPTREVRLDRPEAAAQRYLSQLYPGQQFTVACGVTEDGERASCRYVMAGHEAAVVCGPWTTSGCR